MEATQEIADLKAEIRRLKEVVKDLTELAAVLAEKDERAQRFIEQIRLLGQDDGEQGDR